MPTKSTKNEETAEVAKDTEVVETKEYDTLAEAKAHKFKPGEFYQREGDHWLIRKRS